MSEFVGPRPFKKYLKFYNDEQIRRHDVRPGITGLAQINGRNLISWKEKFQKDLYYVDKLCFFLDMKILFYTFFKVILMKGINASKDITMREFDGN